MQQLEVTLDSKRATGRHAAPGEIRQLLTDKIAQLQQQS